ncbi:MAG: enoyl-ACP reductase FabI [Alphaproteobacteria bacterium]|nr:enoyl-ACP reductase FabI [Alphaproteobacteria bacterium]
MSSRLMEGKRGLIMGIANDHSIAWGIARTLAQHGAKLAITYQGDVFKRRAEPLAESLKADLCLPCDVENIESLDEVFRSLEEKWGEIDFVVHALAYSKKEELNQKYFETTRENFFHTMLISCFSFTEIAKRAAVLMPRGGSLLTLTANGSTRVMPNYNVMGIAKAALESSVRYLAVDLGLQGVRVNAISAGPMRTLAGAGIAKARLMFKYQKQNSAMQKSVTLDDVGSAALYLLSDLSLSVTGNIHFVDAGYNIMCMPRAEHLDTPRT